jgi:hypothetical protein
VLRNLGWVPYAGVAVVAAILAFECGSIPALSDAFAIAGGLAGVGVVIQLIRGSRRATYSLEDLRRVHEKAEIDALEVPEPEDFDSVRCLCGAVYNKRLPVCPECRRSQHSSSLGC